MSRTDIGVYIVLMTKTVIFLNCFLRSPNWFFSDNQVRRIPRIVVASLKHRPDIVGVAEVFGATNCSKMKHLFAQNKYSFIVPGTSHNTGLGCAVHHKYKVLAATFFPFVHSVFPDSLADKGFFIIQIEHKKNKKVSLVIVTHLQATYNDWTDKHMVKKIERVQMQQLLQISHYMAKLRFGMEYIICGDFNIDIHARSRVSRLFAALFPSARLNIQYTTDDRETIDYIISSSDIETIEAYADNSIQPLSDHYLICAKIKA